MKLPNLLKGTLVKRYKRFLADVTLETGETITAHTPNTGSMRTCSESGSTVWLSYHEASRRKLPYTLELVQRPDGTLVMVNTMRTNWLVAEALQQGWLPSLSGFDTIKKEVRFGESRLDFYLSNSLNADNLISTGCFVEVKNCTLLLENGCIGFPDARTLRGTRHLNELVKAKRLGMRAAILFVLASGGGEAFCPAYGIDPEYCKTLEEASKAGVEVIACQCHISETEVKIINETKVMLKKGNYPA